MKALHELKEMLEKEIKDISEKGELTAGSLDTVDKLTHSLKSIETIIAMSGDNGEYSGYYPMYNDNTYHNGGMSYARGDGRRTPRRDSRGRYSGNAGRESLIDRLEEIMDEAPDDRTREAVKRCINQMERE